ncbi:VCBS repeat-containing protein [bacterium]|nr:VCBS repeat-containing protein [bacterium]
MRFLILIMILATTCWGTLSVKWNFPFSGVYSDRMIYGSSPAIAELGINTIGGEPDEFLEIVIGSDEVNSPYSTFYGAWRCIDARGNLEWQLNTRTDEARSSPAIADFDGNSGLGDSIPDIVGGTTCGWSVEAFTNTGSFIWRFADIEGSGQYLWHSSPAVGDVIPPVIGDEIVIGNSNAECSAVFCLEGDISDGWDDGYTGYSSFDHACWDTYLGADGTNWDVLWFHNTAGAIISTPAIGDVDNDGHNDIVVGTGWLMRWFSGATDGIEGRILCLNGVDGSTKWSILSGGPNAQVPCSPALADVDSDGDLEVFVGAGDGYFYCIDGDENHNGSLDPDEMATIYFGGIFYSSAAIADIDNDGRFDIVVGTPTGDIICLDYNPAGDTAIIEWQTHISDSIIISSPAICADGDTIPWLEFRHDSKRTGFYDFPDSSKHIFIGTMEGYLFQLDGNGTVIDSIYLGGSIVTSPAIADIDKDCYIDVLLVSAHITPTNGPDTLWCIGTDIYAPRPGGCFGCDTMTVSILCPEPCFTYSSCENQEISFAIRYDSTDWLDSMRVYSTYEIVRTSGDTLTGHFSEPSDFGRFIFFPPDSAYLFVDFATLPLEDGDSVTVTIDSLFSQSGCKTVP